MLIVRKQVMGLYVDRVGQRWVVRDTDGNFWLVPPVENPGSTANRFSPRRMSSWRLASSESARSRISGARLAAGFGAVEDCEAA